MVEQQICTTKVRRLRSGRSLLVATVTLLAFVLMGTLAACEIGPPSGATKAAQTATVHAAQVATATRAVQATQAGGAGLDEH